MVNAFHHVQNHHFKKELIVTQNAKHAKIQKMNAHHALIHIIYIIVAVILIALCLIMKWQIYIIERIWLKKCKNCIDVNCIDCNENFKICANCSSLYYFKWNIKWMYSYSIKSIFRIRIFFMFIEVSYSNSFRQQINFHFWINFLNHILFQKKKK